MIAVTMTVLCDSESEVPGVMESLGRVGTGIALEGKSVQVSIVTVEDDE